MTARIQPGIPTVGTPPIKTEVATEMPPLRTYLLRLCASALLLLPLLAACNAAEPTPTPTNTPPPGSPETDREALIALYNSANGENWYSPWQIGASMDEWQGVTIDSGGRVVKLKLYNDKLMGYLPPELGNLGGLKVLNLGGYSTLEDRSQLSGRIPPELGNLANLTELHLGGNQLSGEITARAG